MGRKRAGGDGHGEQEDQPPWGPPELAKLPGMPAMTRGHTSCAASCTRRAAWNQQLAGDATAAWLARDASAPSVDERNGWGSSWITCWNAASWTTQCCIYDWRFAWCSKHTRCCWITRIRTP